MNESSNETKKSKGWLLGLLVVLLFLLVIEGGFLIKLRLDERKDKSSRADYGMLQRPAKHAAPAMGFSGSFVDPFGSFGGQNAFDDKWDPFREMEDMQRTMNRLFRDSYSRGLRTANSGQGGMSYNPDVDVRETDKEYVLKLDLPGLDKDKVGVKIENNQIIVSGERQTENEQSSQQGGFYRTERSFGSFLRSFPLPADADADKMTAETKNGVLTVRIPKIAGKTKSAKAVEVQ